MKVLRVPFMSKYVMAVILTAFALIPPGCGKSSPGWAVPQFSYDPAYFSVTHITGGDCPQPMGTLHIYNTGEQGSGMIADVILYPYWMTVYPAHSDHISGGTPPGRADVTLYFNCGVPVPGPYRSFVVVQWANQQNGEILGTRLIFVEVIVQ